MIDFEAEGFLEGLDAGAREERLELLRWLEGEGFTLEQLRTGHESELLPFLPADRVVAGGEPTLTANEIAQRAGVEVDDLEVFRRAQGLPVPDPDEPYYTEEEAAIAFTPVVFSQLGMSDEQMQSVTRVLGRGLAQAAQVMRSAALEVTLEAGLTERELAERYAQTVDQVMPYVPPLIDRLLRMHLRNMLRSEALDSEARASGQRAGERQMSVAFADIVGFTRMGEEVPPDELGRVADRLAILAAEVVFAPVQFVKSIGDAVMLVSDDSSALVDTGLELVAAVEAEGPTFPQVRVGAAAGMAFSRGGDWFGQPVNLASRVTTVARTGSVLASEELRELDADRHRWSFAGERRLKGVSSPVKLFRARPADDPAS